MVTLHYGFAFPLCHHIKILQKSQKEKNTKANIFFCANISRDIMHGVPLNIYPLVFCCTTLLAFHCFLLCFYYTVITLMHSYFLHHWVFFCMLNYTIQLFVMGQQQYTITKTHTREKCFLLHTKLFTHHVNQHKF